MNKHTDESDFAFIHIRPGAEGKAHPIGTIAVELTPVDDYARTDQHRVGVSRNVSNEAWSASRGREVASGRAARSKNPIVITGSKSMSRRELIMRATVGVLDASYDGKIELSKKFQQALIDTIDRLQRADAAARAASASAAQ